MIADCVPHETQAERMLMRGVAVKSVCWRIPRWAEDHGLPFNLELVLENLRDELAGRPRSTASGPGIGAASEATPSSTC